MECLIKPDSNFIMKVINAKDMPSEQVFSYGHILSKVHISWERGFRGKLKTSKNGCPVVIIDTGGNPHHPDLLYKQGKNFTDEQTHEIYTNRNFSWEDNIFGHGIHVGGIACALDNGKGIVGVAPEADLIAAKVFRQDYDRPNSTYTTSKWIADAIRWSVDYADEFYPEYGGPVINLSLGGPYRDRRIIQACDYALDRGAIIVCAAGNDGSANGVDWPAAYERNIAVGAITKGLAKTYYSDAGQEVDVAAPGKVYSTWLYDKYIILQGTSMATPFVAGIAALAKSKYGSRCTQEYFKKLLDQGCSYLNDIEEDGQWRIINSPQIAMLKNKEIRLGLDYEVVV